MRQLPKPGEIYKHFKGNCYRIITIAVHSETGEKLVIYQALYGSYSIYARELSMFMSPVDRNKYPDAAQKMRFELVESGAVNPVAPEPERQSTPTALPDAAESAPAAVSGSEDETERKQKSCFGAENADLSDISDIKQPPKKETEQQIDPRVLAYLDADTCKEKLQILTTMKGKLTDQMINTMAIAIDVEIKPGDITERYEELKYCLATRERFECRRLR